MNILLQDTFGTPHETTPFSRIAPRDYEEAMMDGMRMEDEAIEAVVSNRDTPTFMNTIRPVTDKILDRSATIFYAQLACNTSEEMDAVAEKMAPLLAEHYNGILQNKRLFERVDYVHAHVECLDEEERKLLEDVYDGFVRNGALLGDEDKARLAELDKRLAQTTVRFDQNHLKATNAFFLHITDEAQLSGLPPTSVDAAAMEAKSRGMEGWVFTLHAPSLMPFLKYSDDRDKRRLMWTAYNSQCCGGDGVDNREIVSSLVNMRRERAGILGFACHADYVLGHSMAKTTDNVRKLFKELYDAYQPVAAEEMDELSTFAKSVEGDDFLLMPWDFAYYSQKLMERKFDLDTEKLRPYFRLENVKKGVFSLATRLYGITFLRSEQIEVYHPDVEAYEVYDKDCSFLAVLYTDFFPRPNKQSGAWMTVYSEQFVDENGIDHRPHVTVCTNFTKPSADKPALLTLGEVETFLHEFGHALHGMFSKCRFKSLSGTNVYRDFVELPSQIMENFAVEKDFLHTFARHYLTDETIPDELVGRVQRSRNYHCGYQCLRQLGFGMLDMDYYTLQEPFTEDVEQFEDRSFAPTRMMPKVKGTCMSVQFGHIMSGGYSAGYYSYKWAEALDADAFEMFRQNGIFSRDTAEKFRNEILSKGGTRHPMALYVAFRGQEPTIDALLRRNGIKGAVVKRQTI